MKMKLFFCAILLFEYLWPSPVFALKPSVKAVRIKEEIVYEFVPENETVCDKSGTIHLVGAEKAAGCTIRELKSKIEVSCDNKEIIFGFGVPKYKVELINTLKKGTNEFDMVLKHELTHVRIGQRTIEKFYPSVAQALLMQYERSEKKGKSCPEIQQDVFNIFHKYLKLLTQEQKKHDALIDGMENYEYQWAQLRNMDFEKKIHQSPKKRQTSLAFRPPQKQPLNQKREKPLLLAENKTPPTPVIKHQPSGREPIQQYVSNNRTTSEPSREKVYAAAKTVWDMDDDVSETPSSGSVVSKRKPQTNEKEAASVRSDPYEDLSVPHLFASQRRSSLHSPRYEKPSVQRRSSSEENDPREVQEQSLPEPPQALQSTPDKPKTAKKRTTNVVFGIINGLFEGISEKIGLKEKIGKLTSYVEGLFQKKVPEKAAEQKPEENPKREAK
ncbi:MAG: hypothetical protein J5787_01070 [Alphaproteobacteria bacterium]|nr:hypothetical protein [Alphaproteobacteria bacterium]